MKLHNENGNIFISNEVFTTICGYAATNCFGVRGMASRNVQDGIVQLLRKDSLSKGIKVSFPEGLDLLNIELHIVLEHGVNMPAICGSIVNEIRYNLEKLTSIKVGTVDVFVDGILAN